MGKRLDVVAGKVKASMDLEEVSKMKNPVMFMHPDDIMEFGETPPWYKGVQVSKDIHCEKGKFYITDIKTDLL